ncbi:hypothetical protein H6F77_25300 [Microcoleus sp. FACHB-831]|uniref:hypothetical protein n=1 Tax=Microcoleus sp. FACHB-831 TaxID=2692827 RepID=UPI00168796D2|nr:hypothetical protein [Microcoleus sp. FACHB-831]MBD1924363.1 hypothetical protein [Microcoleus sp. FACHB-831]
MNSTKADLRYEVRQLAEEAFHRKLISGYGDGPVSSEYQIVCNGKPKHFPLEYARAILGNLLRQAR